MALLLLHRLLRRAPHDFYPITIHLQCEQLLFTERFICYFKESMGRPNSLSTPDTAEASV